MPTPSATPVKEAVKPDGVIIIGIGLCYLSCCAPKGMKAEDVQHEVRLQNLAGTTHGWCISKDKKFADGTPMPSKCDKDPKRKHWLLEC